MHYHVLYGPTHLDSPEHKEVFSSLKAAANRLQELYNKYVEEHPGVFFKKHDEGGPEHTIMFGEIPGAIHASKSMESVVYGAEFKDTYMITIVVCEISDCLFKIN